MPPRSNEDRDDIERFHAKIDMILERIGDLDVKMTTIQERCLPCQTAIAKHSQAIYGNGKEGLLTMVARLSESMPKTEMLSVKSIVLLLGAVGTLAATIGGAMAAMVSKVPPATP